MDRWPHWMMLAGAAAALMLSAALVPGLKAANPQSPDILTQILGGTRDLVAEQAYREADLYFHAGYECECPDEDHHHAGGHEHEVPHGPAEPQHAHADLPLIGLVERLHGETAPKIHRHLQGEEEKELLPWFVAAVRLNPQHVEAWRVGSYWFYRTGDARRAEQFITDGIACNPGAYRLYLDRGVLYYRSEEWRKAVTDLERAGELWKGSSEDASYDRKAIRTYLGDARARLEAE